MLPNQWPQSSALPYVQVEADTETVPIDKEPWGWIELFVAIQLLWGLLLFVPGMQAVRIYVRALPYVTSLAGLLYYMTRGTGEKLAPQARWLVAVFALLALNLLHTETHVTAGVAQMVFQTAIAAPMFWVVRTVRSEARFLRLLWVIFIASFVSAAIGVLQVYYPDQFLPPEFSTLGRALNPEFVNALTSIGPGGRLIIRPPGLSDLPGGAAISGLTTMVLGIALAIHGHRSRVLRTFCFAAAAVGMTALYLTQVRSLTLMAVLSVLMFIAVGLRQGRVAQSGWIAATGAALVFASFIWAVAAGGESVAERFSGLADTGVFTTFQESRGLFLNYTMNELLTQYPLGAGLGRWGMMQVYFGDSTMWQSPPIHVEIQLTGWLLDGGALMWLCYGGAILSALRFTYVLAVRGATDTLQYFATVVLAIQLTIFGLCFAGPVFNTQLGIEFWTLTAALFGAVGSWQVEEEAGERAVQDEEAEDEDTD